MDVPLIFFCPADNVPDWQPRVLLGMVEARSVNVKKTTTTTNEESEMEHFGRWMKIRRCFHHLGDLVNTTLGVVGLLGWAD